MGKIIRRYCAWCEQLQPLAVFSAWLLCIGFFGYGVYTLRSWWTDTQPVIEFIGGELSATAARPNELLIAYVDVRKLRDCPGVSQRRLTGDCGEHVLSEAATYRPTGFVGRVTLPFQVPEAAIPGACAFQVHSWFVCNPLDFLHDRHYASTALPFVVKSYHEN